MKNNNKVNAPKSVEVDTTKKQNVFADQLAQTGGGASSNTKLILLDVSPDDIRRARPPRQVMLVCKLLHDLGGTATVGQLNDLIIGFMNDTNDNFWVRPNGVSYVQDIYPVMTAYMSQMLGSKEWGNKKGKLPLVKTS
tara:strand:+ start:32 stop:445 length:414 start_codon:yes stop_codon:yes gene_type:complete